MTEIERIIAEEHSELDRGDVFDQVQEWMMEQDESGH
jgi:hypothetical protein